MGDVQLTWPPRGEPGPRPTEAGLYFCRFEDDRRFGVFAAEYMLDDDDGDAYLSSSTLDSYYRYRDELHQRIERDAQIVGPIPEPVEAEEA